MIANQSSNDVSKYSIYALTDRTKIPKINNSILYVFILSKVRSMSKLTETKCVFK